MSDEITSEDSELDTIIEDPEGDENEIELATPSAQESLRYFGVDFDVEGLVRRFERGELVIPRFNPPDEAAEDIGYEAFQRDFVWKKKQMDRFVESILLGYPVPGIFLVELETRQYIVLDGQQRLTTLRDFYRGEYASPRGAKPFKLDYVATDSPFHGQSYGSLSASDTRLLNNALIQATVVLPDGEQGKMAIYALFERINSGGTKLNEQQIRVAIYNGSVTKMIRDMNDDANWRLLFGASKPHRDLKDQELILRYLTLKDVAHAMSVGEASPYKAPLAAFMTKYLDDHDLSFSAADKDRELVEFSRACALLVDAGGNSALRRNRTINAARSDSILAGIALALREGVELDSKRVSSALARLDGNAKYRENTEKSTSHRSSVDARLSEAVKAFRNI